MNQGLFCEICGDAYDPADHTDGFHCSVQRNLVRQHKVKMMSVADYEFVKAENVQLKQLLIEVRKAVQKLLVL